MGQKIEKNTRDILGLFTLGSLIGNVVQAEKHGSLKRERNRLVSFYKNLLERYKVVCREYQALRQFNEELQKQVMAGRAENNRLLGELASLKGARK